MPVFGDKNTFGISCNLPDATHLGLQPFICCHYLIAGELIGHEGEYDLLGTCAGDLGRSRQKIKELQVVGHESVFDGLSDLESLNLVRKANQLKKEFYQQFIHLPQQHDSFWYAHKLWLAESTDKTEVIILNYQDMLKVIKQPYCEERCEVKSVVCGFDAANDIFSDCLYFLKNSYPDHLSRLQL